MRLPFSTAVVTGGAGFIGSHLVDSLIEDGVNVTVLDNLSGGNLTNLSARRSTPKLKFLKGDITDPTIVRQALRGAEVVFHEAAIVDVQRSLREPDLTYAVNVEGTERLLEAAVSSDAERFILASSAAVYGDSPQLPRTEDALTVPMSPYATSKVRAEALVEDAYRRTGIRTTSLRYFNIYGTRSTAKAYSGVINAFAESILNGKPLVIYGDGSQCRDFVEVSDIVAANLLAASNNNASGRIYNVGTGVKTTILELAKGIIRILDGPVSRGRIEFEPFRKGDVRESFADISRIRDELAFLPSISLATGLERYLESTYGPNRMSGTGDDI